MCLKTGLNDTNLDSSEELEKTSAERVMKLEKGSVTESDSGSINIV